MTDSGMISFYYKHACVAIVSLSDLKESYGFFALFDGSDDVECDGWLDDLHVLYAVGIIYIAAHIKTQRPVVEGLPPRLSVALQSIFVYLNANDELQSLIQQRLLDF